MMRHGTRMDLAFFLLEKKNKNRLKMEKNHDDDNDDDESLPEESLFSRIVETLRCEMNKNEIRQKIKPVLEPFLLCLLTSLQPYLITLTVLLVMICVCQIVIIVKVGVFAPFAGSWKR